MKEPSISRPPRILCLEDNFADQELLEHTLASDGLVCEFVHATTKDEFEKALAHASFDLIISDFGLPAYNGMAALATARDVQANTPFVFVSGTIGEERAVESLRNGATDYVLKDRRDRLVSAVRRALRESQERADRRHAEEQVRIQATALEAAANGIFITDRNGKILSANKAFCTASGHALEEVMGKTPAFLKSGKHPPEFYRDLWRTVLSGRVWQGEVTNRRKDGAPYDEDVTITPVHDSGGQISHFIAVTQDITWRKQLEEQLRQSQKMEAIGQLAGGVAHDFNNLLTIILCNASAALSCADQIGDETRECLKQVSAASLRAADLTRQLLTFSRKQAMQLQPLDLNEVLGPLAKMLRRIIGEHVELCCPHGGSPAFVQADAGMMEQVIFNLAVNARDAMPRGGQLMMTAKNVTLDERQVKAHPEAQSGEFVLLSVSDTGTGISPEHLTRIFEPFFTTKEAGKGTGLGLATVYGIVKQHRGWIEVRSRLGEGTTFDIYFPAIQPLPSGPARSIPYRRCMAGPKKSCWWKMISPSGRWPGARSKTPDITSSRPRPEMKRSKSVKTAAQKLTCFSRTWCCPAGSMAANSPINCSARWLR